MTKQGVIESYTVSIVSKNYVTVSLQIRLEETNKPVTAEIRGTLKDVCSKLNSIPIAGKLTGKHLINAECTLIKEGSEYRFLYLGR